MPTEGVTGQVSRRGKILGPGGLMPPPKAGTVVSMNQDIGAAVREFKAGKVEYRADKGGNVHAGVGKLSFDVEKLAANVHAFLEQLRSAKPARVQGHYIQNVTISATTSPRTPITTS